MRSLHITSSAAALALAAAAAPAFADVSIDTAQQSGVSGYPIGIFGAGFGNTQGKGKVTILGAEASVTKWTDGVIEASVPKGTPGVGKLVVTANDGGSAESPFELYAIDSKFLARPADLVNLAYKKPFVITGKHDDWAGDPKTFLGFNDGSGGNDMAADFTPPFTLATDLGEAVQGDAWFSWFDVQGSTWVARDGGYNPSDYTIEASVDGSDGSWVTLATVKGYDRNAKIDKVSMSGQRWIRMNCTAVYSQSAAHVAEIRVYKRMQEGGTGIDAIGIYGDSITFGDHRETGPQTFYELIRAGKNNGSVPMGFVMGMIGQNTAALQKGNSDANSLATALPLVPELRYLGIALGTNVRTPMKPDFVDAVDQILAAGKIPILARMPDTDASRGGYGDAAYKKSVIQAVDEVAAQYKLIPGPDFYSAFRQNLSAYISDGTHHTAEGGAAERRLWADTFLRSGIYGGDLAPPQGGSPSTGAGGKSGTGGTGSAQGGSATAGKTGSGGSAQGSGGKAGTSTGGSVSAAGGAVGSSGGSGSAVAGAGAVSSGTTGGSGASGASSVPTDSDGGSSCSVVRPGSSTRTLWPLALGLGLAALARARRGRRGQPS